MKCPNCGSYNKNTNIRCDFCGNELNSVNYDNFLNSDYLNIPTFKISGKKVGCFGNAILIFVLVPWFLVGLVFVLMSGSSIMSNNTKSKGMQETQGTLVDYSDCQYEGNVLMCNGVYEYVVDGVSYKGSPSIRGSKSALKETIIVKYNSNNPSEYVMDFGWGIFFVVGVIMMIFSLVLFISIRLIIKKHQKKFDENMESN